MRYYRARIGLTLALSISVFIVSCIYLSMHGIDAIEGRNYYQFFADANTYHEFARSIDSFGSHEIISVGRNLIGPLLVVIVSGDNYYIVCALNVLIFYLSVKMLSWDARIDPLFFAAILLLNPMTISSLMAANKEILSLLFLALLVRAWLRKSGLWLVFAALVAIGVRWQLLAFVILLTPFALGWRLPPRNRVSLLVSIAVGLSITYALALEALSHVTENFEAAASSYSEGSGLFVKLVLIQMDGLYFLVAPIKAAHLLFGLGLRFDRLLSPVDIYNDIWQLLGSTALLLMFLALVVKRIFRIQNDIVFVSLIYILLFSLSPIYAPRYFYVVYAMWALVYCLYRQGIKAPDLGGIHRLPPLARQRSW
ncbi:MAG: hypothetical protein IBJ07_06580 [Rhizobiaceae bacterium]|nr:hypothetical protein [Rhizobiaceae bacterium]